MTDAPKRRPRQGSPAPDLIIAERQRVGRTQTQVSELLHVSLRQVQRWEAGEQDMPSATWRFFRLTCGFHYHVDFVRTAESTSGHDTLRDRPRERDTIERGDIVELHALDGTRIRAVVWLDRVHDGLSDEESYGAILLGFPDQPAQAQLGKFAEGERITFARENVIHIEQRVPAKPTA